MCWLCLLFFSFHPLIPLLSPVGRRRSFEQGSGWRSCLCQAQSSRVSFKLHRLILKVKGKRQPACSFLLQTATGWMYALLQWSVAKVISEGLSCYLCKPLWNEAGGEKQSEIGTHRNDMLLIFVRCLASSSRRSEKGRQ